MFAFTDFIPHPHYERAVTFSSVVNSARAYDTSLTIASAVAKLEAVSADDLRRLELDHDTLGCDPDCEPIACIASEVASDGDAGVLDMDLISILTILFDGWEDLAIDCYRDHAPIFED